MKKDRNKQTKIPVEIFERNLQHSLCTYIIIAEIKYAKGKTYLVYKWWPKQVWSHPSKRKWRLVSVKTARPINFVFLQTDTNLSYKVSLGVWLLVFGQLKNKMEKIFKRMRKKKKKKSLVQVGPLMHLSVNWFYFVIDQKETI